MRKLFIILLLVTGFVNAQNIIVSSKNSTTTALDSAATYTGTAELNTNYSYLTIVVKSNVSGASNGVIVKMGATASTLYTNQFFTYTTNDSLTNRFTVHLTGKYFKVMYINGTTDQTTFDLKTYMHTEEVLPVDANGNIKVNVAVSALPSGASTATRQDTLLAVQKNIRSWLAALMTYSDAVEAKLDSIDASSTRNEVKLDAIKTSVELIDNTVSGNELQVDVVGALPAGTAIVGQVGIDQTTDGTTNKVQARNATHDNFNTNANIQVGDADVANGNPVPVSDAGGALTVDGSVTANAGTNLNTSALSLESSQLILLGYMHPATISTGTLTTVSTEVDTTTFTSTVWQTFGAFAVDDTLEIALSGSFADSKIVYPYTAYTFENFSPTTFTKGYIRRYGSDGTVTYTTTVVGY